MSYTLRPYLTAVKTEQKLSSVSTISQADLATSVPEIPMENPTSAFFKAGASLVPSPVTATTFPYAIRPVTSRYLSSGELLARTFNSAVILSKTDWSATLSTISLLISSETRPPIASLNYFPVMHVYPCDASTDAATIPASLLIAMAVSMLSPVTILTLIPDLWHCYTACLMPGLKGSCRPNIPTMHKPLSTTSRSSSPTKLLFYAFV